MSRTFFLSPEDAALNDAGVVDLHWPISRRETCMVRDRFEQNMLSDMRPGLARDDADWAVVRVLMYEIARDVVAGWQLTALRRRMSEADFELSLPPRGYSLLQALTAGQDLPPPMALAALRRGLKAPARWAIPLRAVRNFLRRDAFSRQRAHRMRPGDIGCVSSAPFIARHAAAVATERNRRVVLCSFWEWFSLNDADRAAALATPALSAATMNRILEHAVDAYTAGGERMPEQIARGMQAWVIEASRWVRFYMDRMRARPERLPRTLWYGSANNWWTRMLRAVVQETGGYCVGHDHGRGVGACPNEGEHGPVFDLCDEYVAYSPALAAALENIRAEIVPRLPSGGTGPKFSHAPANCLPPPVLRDQAPEERKIMYIAPLYLGERVAGMNCLPADLVWLDWQARLLSHLSGDNRRVSFKGHPESVFPPPATLLDMVQAEEIGGIVETCHQVASAFVCDFLSTPFKTMVYTDRPIVFIDHGLGRLSPEIRRIIERRCAVVDGGFTESNRLDLSDWGGLDDALRLAEERRLDRSCGHELFGYPR